MDNNKIYVETLLDRVTTSWDGSTLENYPSGKPTFTMQKIIIPPKCKMERHNHDVMNLGYILQGELTISTDDGATVTFRAGDPAVEIVETMHYGENRGDVETVVLVITIL